MPALMTAARPQSLIATRDQWLRSGRRDTVVDGARGDLVLSWHDPVPVAPPDDGGCPARGLAVDRLCRVYRLHTHSVERLRVGPTAAGLDYAALPAATTVVGGDPAAAAVGPDFTAVPVPDLLDATGIAVDGDDRMFVADRGRRTIAVLDLWSRRLLRVVSVATPRHPGRYAVGLAHRAGAVYAVVNEPHGLLRLTASSGPHEVDLPPAAADLGADARPARVAVLPDGVPVVLYLDGDGGGWLVAGDRPAVSVGPASDVVVDAEGVVVVAPCPRPDGAASLRRLTPTSDGWSADLPLDASGYDGNGLVATADGRIGYFSAEGFRLAVVGAVTYDTGGTCVSYRFDSGVPANTWGRLFLEACIPDGTDCLVGCVTTDDETTPDAVRTPPDPNGRRPSRGLHRRPEPVTPWWPLSRGYDSYEAPVVAPPGRYLWVILRLTGNQRRTPRVRELRIEHRGHTLLRRLPAVFAADPRQADFLYRYLAFFDGLLSDLDLRAQCRDILLDPSGTPPEALDWLASFVGLVLDDRWALPARRRLVAEIVPLYRRRGTVWALRRYLAIYLAGERAADPSWVPMEPVVVEHFRLRGVGGPLLGDPAERSTRNVVGAGFRVGGAVGGPDDDRALEVDASSAFETYAHRFTVLVPRPLDSTQEGAVRHVLDTERPAHTAYTLCTVDAGMRVGRGLHVGLTSVVGPTGSFAAAVLDQSLLGRDVLLGGPGSGVAVESARVGTGARVG